jgi:hypothetical protein
MVAAQGSACRAQSQAAVTQQLEQRLSARVSVAWQGQELATALERLAGVQGLPLWIDRRVDPSTPVELTVTDQPLGDTINALAASHNWAVAPYFGVFYFGPRETAAELLTLSALARQSIAKTPLGRELGAERPAAARSRWLKAEPWSAPRLSEPRELVVQIARAAGAAVVDEQLIPHDLWPARELPAMAPLDRAVLLLSGFDLTCQVSADGKKLQIVPIQRPVQVSHTYTVGRARKSAVDVALAGMTAAKVERTGQGMTLTSRVEDHLRLQAAIRGDRPKDSPRKAPRASRPSKPAGQRFTLKIENQPAGRVIDQLARQLQLVVEWDAALEKSPKLGREASVSCDVHEADLDELLTAVLSPAGLVFERDGKRLSIRRGE